MDNKEAITMDGIAGLIKGLETHTDKMFAESIAHNDRRFNELSHQINELSDLIDGLARSTKNEFDTVHGEIRELGGRVSDVESAVIFTNKKLEDVELSLSASTTAHEKEHEVLAEAMDDHENRIGVLELQTAEAA